MSAPEATAWRARLLALLPWLLPAAAGWVWFASLQATSFDRIRTLQCVEPYALAVYDQLAYTFSQTRAFAQTIHFGYDDNWMWSGHRSIFLPVVSLLYGLSPGPVWLCRIQLLVLALGVLPAFGLGRRALGGTAGGLFGILAYAAYPPLMIIALGDYQDVVLGVPFLLGALWASREGRPGAFVALAALTACAREEWVAMLPLIGLSVPGGWRTRARWVAGGVGVAAVMGGILWALGLGIKGHDNPMASHIGDLLTWPLPITRTWADVTGFYLELLRPVHALGLLAPATLLPAAGPLFFHLTAPADGGVDTDFAHHIHHMAPVAAWVVAATIDGAALLTGLLSRWPRARQGAVVALVLGTAAVAAVNARPWLTRFGIVPQASLSVRLRPPSAPEWALAAKAPEDAPIATDVRASLTVSTRLTAYTYDESLRDKAPAKGLRAVEYLMVRKAHAPWVALATAWPGSEVLGETRDYTLYRLPPEGADALSPGAIFPSGTLTDAPPQPMSAGHGPSRDAPAGPAQPGPPPPGPPPSGPPPGP